MNNLLSIFKRILICVFALILAVSGSFTVKAETPDETDFTESSELTAEETLLPEIPAETVSVNADNIIPNESEFCLVTGETSQLTYTLEPSDATEIPVWSSTDPGCVSVDENGLITAVSAGQAGVKAAIANGNQAYYGVYVIDQQPDSICFDSVDISVYEGDLVNVSLYVTPESSQYCKKYVSSDNPSVVYPESNAFYGTDLTLHAENAGQTTVTVTTENGLSTSITVIVNSKSEAEYNITTTEPTVGMRVGESRYLEYSISPDDGTQTVTWGLDYADNNCISLGHDGMIEAQDYGTARVYAEISNGNRQYYDIYVCSSDPQSFSLPTNTNYMRPYSDKYFAFNVSPWEAQYCRKQVVSDNPSAVMVNEEYVYTNYVFLTSFGSGSANITVTADNGVSITFTVNVFNGTPADSISSNEKVIGLKVGESKQLPYTLEPSNADEKPIWYDEWNNGCVSVDENGVVTGLKNGHTIIIAKLTNDSYVAYNVYVNVTDPASISYDRDSYKVGLETYKSVYFNINPWNAQYCRKKIVSSDPSVLRVEYPENSEYIYDPYVNIYGVSTGTVTLTVTADNGVTKSVEVEVVSGNFADWISSNETEIGMKPGESRQLTYTLSPETADEVPGFRLSYDTDIISVDNNGVVTANRTGSAQVIAELINGSTVYYSIYVSDDPVSMTVSNYNGSYIVGTNASNNLNINTVPNTAYNCRKHVTSSNPEIVRIEREWTFENYIYYYGVSEGKATVTIEADNGVSTSVEVEVIDGLASYISVPERNIYMQVGDTLKIPYTLQPSSATEIPEFSVNSSNQDIISVDETGIITALKAGHTYLTLKLKNGNGNTLDVFVADGAPQSIQFKQNEYATLVGNNISLADQLVYDPPGSKYGKITCTSSDSSIASVQSYETSPADLYINTYKSGEATITVTSENGVSASTKIKVIGGYANRIYITNGQIILKPGETEELEYHLDSYSGDTSKENVTFVIISGSECVSFDNGKVTALKPGKAVIEARTSLYYGLPDELADSTNFNLYQYRAQYGIVVSEEPASLEFDKAVYQAKINEEVAGFVYSDSADSDFRKLTYTSSDQSVASVYSYGDNFVITGVSAGTAVITATAENGVSTQAQVVVSDEAFVNNQYHIKDNYLNWLYSVKIGEEVDLSDRIKDMYDQAPDFTKVELVSDNPAVLSASGSVIKGVSAGSANLFINNKESNYEQRNTIVYSVIVTDTERISFEQSEYTVNVGDTILLRKILKTEPVNYTMQTIEFTADDPDVAAVYYDWMDWSNLYAKKAGDTVITASTKDGITAQMTLHVVDDDPFNDLILSEETPVVMHKDYVKTLKLNGPSYNALKSYTLTSADNHIVSILSDNTLFARECGTTTITATLKTDSTKQLSIPVTVVDGDPDTYAYTTVLRKLNGDKDSFEYGDEFTCYVGEQYTFNAKAQWTEQYGEEHPYYDPLYGKGYETENNSIIPLTFEGGMGWASGPSAYGNSSKYMQFMAIRPGTARIYTTGNRYVTIHVVEPAASLTINAPKTEIYTEETLQLSAEIESEIPVTDPVSWKSSDTSVLTVDETGKVTGISAGKATVTARAGRLQDSVEITVIGPLEAELITDDEIYATEPTVLKATATGGSAPYKYQFTAKIDGKWTTLHNGTESEYTYTFKQAGSYPVNVTVTDSTGTRVKSQKTLTVEVRPSEDPLDAELILAEDVYAGEATVLKATATGGSAPYKYQFTAKIDGRWTTLKNGTESECTYTFEKAGSYPVNVTVTDSTGARVKSQKTLTVTVRPSEDPLDAELILAEDVYAGEATVLKAEATGGSAPYKYQFTAKIDGKWTTLQNGTESECTYTFEKAGSYPVNVTVTDNAGTRVKSQKTLTVEVRPSEDPLAAEILIEEDVYAGEPTLLKATATGGSAPYRYQFTAKIDGKWTTLHNGTESEWTYTFEKAGSYPVNVTVTDSTGARVKSQKTLRVLEP